MGSRGIRRCSPTAVGVMLAMAAIASLAQTLDGHGKQAIYLDEASRSAAWHAGWSDATVSHGTVYLSGIVVGAKHAASDRDVELASDQAFSRMKRTLESAGAAMDDVADITVYMVDVQAHLPALDKARLKAMRPPYAASTVVQVSRLIPDGAIAEIRAVAHPRSPADDYKEPE